MKKIKVIKFPGLLEYSIQDEDKILKEIKLQPHTLQVHLHLADLEEWNHPEFVSYWKGLEEKAPKNKKLLYKAMAAALVEPIVDTRLEAVKIVSENKEIAKLFKIYFGLDEDFV